MPDTKHTFKMDLEKKGFLMFFKPWQLLCLETIWGSSVGLNSREVWEPVSDVISRASVVFFLEDMTRNGLLNKHEVTARGGRQGVYKLVFDKIGTKLYLKQIFNERLDQL